MSLDLRNCHYNFLVLFLFCFFLILLFLLLSYARDKGSLSLKRDILSGREFGQFFQQVISGVIEEVGT